MKVGILTFPDVINHGAYLQAYALSKTIESFNHTVTLVPYKNFKHWLNEYKALLIKKNPASAFSNFMKILKFRNAQKKLNLKKITFLKNKINREHYDIIVVGSDIVWNFISPFLGKDHIYFGHGLNTKRIISYAPSFGYVEKNKEIPDYVVDGLKKFSHISVRDENSKQVVQKAVGKEAQIVLDPTFLYDYYGQEIEPKFENYMLIYAFHLRPEEIEQIRDFARNNGLKTISIALKNNWCDHNIIALGPFEWLGFFKKASYIVTGLFHGTIFSIRYQKRFCISMNEPIENKVKTILEKFGLSKQIVSRQNSVRDALSNKIDYEFATSAMNESIDSSIKYLREAVDG